MSTNKSMNHENCTLCGNPVTPFQKASTRSNLGDSEVLERINELNRGKIDESKISAFVVCNKCRYEVDITYECVKKCRGLMCVQPSVNPKHLKDANIQTNSPELIILVNHISQKIDQKDLKDVFLEYGGIAEFYFSIDKTSPNDFAHITFISEDETLKVMAAAKNKELKFKDELVVVTRVSEDSSPIDILPDACLIKIFLCIDEVRDKVNIARVCKRWRRVLAHSWSNVENFSNEWSSTEEMTSVEGLEWIFEKCGVFLKDLTLKVHPDPVLRLKLISEHCKNIENLKLGFYCYPKSGECLYFSELLSVFQQCNKLRRLCIHRLNKEFDKIVEQLPKEMLEIHLSGSGRCSDNRLSMELSKFQNLQALFLCTFSIEEDTLRGIEKLVNLEYLTFSSSRVHPSNIQGIRTLNKLKSLTIPRCGIDDQSLIRIAQQNLDLEYLDINGNQDITDRPFKYIARLPKLKTLWMRNLTRVTGSYLSDMQNLERLDVEGCSSMADWPLMMLIDKSSKLSLLDAAGPATWRLLKNAEESLELGRANPNIQIFVDEQLAKRWKDFRRYEKKKLCLNGKRDYPKMIWSGWREWHGTIKKL